MQVSIVELTGSGGCESSTNNQLLGLAATRGEATSNGESAVGKFIIEDDMKSSTNIPL